MIITFLVLTVLIGLVFGWKAGGVMLLAPVLGLIFGGFCWALAAMVWPSLVSPEAFAGSVAMATALAVVWALKTD